MKVVLFCGGFGLRMREASEQVPKPMIPVGERGFNDERVAGWLKI